MSAAISMPPGPGTYLLIASFPLLVFSEFRSTSYVGTCLFKMLSSVAFASGPLLRTLTDDSPYCQLITTGLLFSLIGDFFLLPSRRDFSTRDSTKEERKISVSFQLGVVAFAAAHIAYVFAFLRDSRETSRELLATAFVATMVLAKWLGVVYPPPQSSAASNVLDLAISPDMRPLVLVYALIISSMFAVAVSTVPLSFSTAAPYQRSLGAAMFVASDLFVAKDAFGRSSAPNQRGWFRIAVGYGLYFWGQMVIAGTVGAHFTYTARLSPIASNLPTRNYSAAFRSLDLYSVIKAACRLGFKKIITASTICVYSVGFAEGDVDFPAFPVDEALDVNPMDTYAILKMCGERVARGFARRFGVDIYVFRIGRLVEPQEYAEAMFDSYFKEPHLWKAHGWPYTDARDLGQICERAILTNGLGFQVFNATNDEITMNFLKEQCPNVPFTRDIEGREAPISNRKIKDLLGFRQEHPWQKYLPGAQKE